MLSFCSAEKKMDMSSGRKFILLIGQRIKKKLKHNNSCSLTQQLLNPRQELLKKLLERLLLDLQNFLQFYSSHLKPVKMKQNMIIGTKNQNILIFLPGIAEFSPHFLIFGCKEKENNFPLQYFLPFKNSALSELSSACCSLSCVQPYLLSALG